MVGRRVEGRGGVMVSSKVVGVWVLVLGNSLSYRVNGIYTGDISELLSPKRFLMTPQ